MHSHSSVKLTTYIYDIGYTYARRGKKEERETFISRAAFTHTGTINETKQTSTTMSAAVSRHGCEAKRPGKSACHTYQLTPLIRACNETLAAVNNLLSPLMRLRRTRGPWPSLSASCQYYVCLLPLLNAYIDNPVPRATSPPWYTWSKSTFCHPR